jgi:hypothetical protein
MFNKHRYVKVAKAWANDKAFMVLINVWNARELHFYQSKHPVE